MSLTGILNHQYQDRKVAPGLELPAWFAAVVSTRATIDTAIGLTRKRDGKLVALLREPPLCVVKHDPNYWWWRYHVTRPLLGELLALDAHADHKSRCDIAIDFHFDSWHTADQARAWMADHVHLNWKKCKKRWDHGTTLYWEDYDERPGPGLPARSMTLYEKQHDDRIIRLELKFQSSAAVRASGLNNWSLDGLRAISPRAVFEKHVTLKALDPKWLEMQTNRKLANWRNRGRSKAYKQELADRLAGAYSVERGITQPLPTKPMDETIIGAFMAMIPIELEVT